MWDWELNYLQYRDWKSDNQKRLSCQFLTDSQVISVFKKRIKMCYVELMSLFNLPMDLTSVLRLLKQIS